MGRECKKGRKEEDGLTFRQLILSVLCLSVCPMAPPPTTTDPRFVFPSFFNRASGENPKCRSSFWPSAAAAAQPTLVGSERMPRLGQNLGFVPSFLGRLHRWFWRMGFALGWWEAGSGVHGMVGTGGNS